MDESSDSERRPVAIDVASLTPEALRGLVESFIGREGTDYGSTELSLDQKVANLMRQLECGEAVVVFDPETESVTIVRSDEL